LAKQSWETKDDESISINPTKYKNHHHRTRSRSFGPGDMSKYYMAALDTIMNRSSSNHSCDTSSCNKSNQEILKELNDNGIISLRRRNSLDQNSNNSDLTSPIFEKINGLTNSEFIDLYLDIVQRNLSFEELLQRINNIH